MMDSLLERNRPAPPSRALGGFALLAPDSVETEEAVKKRDCIGKGSSVHVRVHDVQGHGEEIRFSTQEKQSPSNTSSSTSGL